MCLTVFEMEFDQIRNGYITNVQHVTSYTYFVIFFTAKHMVRKHLEALESLKSHYHSNGALFLTGLHNTLTKQHEKRTRSCHLQIS